MTLGREDLMRFRGFPGTLGRVKVRDWRGGAFLLGLGLLFSGAGLARNVVIGTVVQAAAVDSRVLGGAEMLAVWTLPRLGVSVRNDPLDTRLVYGARELRFSPVTGWVAVGFRGAPPLPAPEALNGSLYVPLVALKALGVRVTKESANTLEFAAPAVVPVQTLGPSPALPAAPSVSTAPSATAAAKPTPVPPRAPVAAPLKGTSPAPATKPAPTPVPAPSAPVAVPPAPPAPAPTSDTPGVTAPTRQPPQPQPPQTQPPQPQPQQPLANLNTVRVSRSIHRNVEVQRVVLELSRATAHTIERQKGGLSIKLGGVSASESTSALSSGDTLTVTPDVGGAVVSLTTGGGTSEIFTLDDPPRVVVDTTTVLDAGVPPPINPENLPDGVTYLNRGLLHLLSFDPASYQPRVVSAPAGRFADLASLVKSVRGVGGVNGGYFDPASALPVDLVVSGGLMTASSLERRATVGFTPAGEAMFGYPKPRYVLRGNFSSLLVNVVGARVRRDLLTAFVGDGRTAVGADDLTTLYVPLNGETIQSAVTGRVVPPAGTLSLTFDPARFPQLPRAAGQALKVELVWRSSDAPWEAAQEALSAGPLLVSGGKVALDPARENFNTNASIWRPTKQVALGTFQGRPTIAFFEYGTPEAFAAALAGVGVRDAVRLDSGSSAGAYLSSGYGTLGGYLNGIWSQNVPNAIVFVPKTTLGGK
ncbi:phosphodiester glycosidase family protein [Deinococcus fonticola]|uniref:phosphodiester glycosidase family protein n=1 Tax=Deinococcus fonticola TaxID=2528713 RepID=UPI0030B844F0